MSFGIQKLAQHELDLLTEFLASDSVSQDAMALPEAHGLITAVVSAPSTLVPSEWMPLIYGGEPEFESMEQAQEILSLLMWMNNLVAKELEAKTFLPLDYPDPTAVELWCGGYLSGSRLDSLWSEEEFAIMLFPLVVLAREFDLVGEEDHEGNVITDATSHIERMREQLPEHIQQSFELIREVRGEVEKARAGEGARVVPKVGRNDPCPCKSGKKYKKCCGRRGR